MQQQKSRTRSLDDFSESEEEFQNFDTLYLDCDALPDDDVEETKFVKHLRKQSRKNNNASTKQIVVDSDDETLYEKKKRLSLLKNSNASTKKIKSSELPERIPKKMPTQSNKSANSSFLDDAAEDSGENSRENSGEDSGFVSDDSRISLAFDCRPPEPELKKPKKQKKKDDPTVQLMTFNGSEDGALALFNIIVGGEDSVIKVPAVMQTQYTSNDATKLHEWLVKACPVDTSIMPRPILTQEARRLLKEGKKHTEIEFQKCKDVVRLSVKSNIMLWALGVNNNGTGAIKSHKQLVTFECEKMVRSRITKTAFTFALAVQLSRILKPEDIGGPKDTYVASGFNKKKSKRELVEHYRRVYFKKLVDNHFIKNIVTELRTSYDSIAATAATAATGGAGATAAAAAAATTAMATTTTTTAVVTTESPVVPSTRQSLANSVDLKSKISYAEHGDQDFIVLYVTYIYFELIRPCNLLVDKLNEIDSFTGQISECILKLENDQLIEELKAINDSLHDCIQQSFVTVDEILKETVCKVGVTCENFTTWQARAKTFNLKPKYFRAECLNIPKTDKNADCIEKLVFAILSHIGLKIPTSKVKSNQAEFFKVFVQLKDEEGLVNVMSKIQLVIGHCANLTESLFVEWMKVYTQQALHNKDMSTIKFDTNTIQKFFSVEGLEDMLDMNDFNANEYHDDDVDKSGDLILDDNEKSMAKRLDTPLKFRNDAQMARGVSGVVNRLYSAANSEHDEDDDDNDDDSNYEMSAHFTTGIFYQSTATEIAGSIVAKVSINRRFELCIIGVHCVISISRLLLALRGFVDRGVLFVVNIIDVSEKKLNHLQQLLEKYKIFSDDVTVNYLLHNFLQVDNSELQTNNVIICFLHESVDSCFALKITLLQYFVNPNNEDGLQHLLFTKKILKLVSSYESFSVKAEKIYIVSTYRPGCEDELELHMRDLHVFTYINEIFPNRLISSMKYWKIWEILKQECILKCSNWTISPKNTKNKTSLDNILTTDFVIKKCAEFNNPVLQLSSTQSKRIELVVRLKEYLSKNRHDRHIVKLMETDSIQMKTKLYAKLDNLFLGICSQIYSFGFEFYSQYLQCCGMTESDFNEQVNITTLSTRQVLETLSGRPQQSFDLQDALQLDIMYIRGSSETTLNSYNFGGTDETCVSSVREKKKKDNKQQKESELEIISIGDNILGAIGSIFGTTDETCVSNVIGGKEKEDNEQLKESELENSFFDIISNSGASEIISGADDSILGGVQNTIQNTTCHSCSQNLPKSNFSNNQWNKRTMPKGADCKTCVATKLNNNCKSK